MRAIGVEPLYPVVPLIHDIYLESRGAEGHGAGTLKFTVPVALDPPGADYHAHRVELDYPVVACVGDVNVARGIEGDATGV